MIKYLKGSDVELDATRYKARLSGIANELYILQTESQGTNYNIGTYGTLYGNKIFKQKQDSGLLAEDGSIKWTYLDDWALEIDTTSNEYVYMIQIHKDKLVDILTGWDLS